LIYTLPQETHACLLYILTTKQKLSDYIKSRISVKSNTLANKNVK